jgi:hypothetical protein
MRIMQRNYAVPCTGYLAINNDKLCPKITSYSAGPVSNFGPEINLTQDIHGSKVQTRIWEVLGSRSRPVYRISRMRVFMVFPNLSQGKFSYRISNRPRPLTSEVPYNS